MINNDIEHTIIFSNDFLLSLSDKQSIANKIANAIKQYNCYIFDYTDGENLVPIKDYYTNINTNNYAIPTDFYRTNKYLIANKYCLELLNKCDGNSYKLENIVEMDRYLFDFDFDFDVNLAIAIQEIKNILIDYDLPCRCVYTGNRGVHIVFIANKVNNINDYKKVWNKLLQQLDTIIPNSINGNIDLGTNIPNKYTRVPNADRNGALQYLVYDNLKYYEIVLYNDIDIKQTKNHFHYTNTSNKYEHWQYTKNDYIFNLDSFYKNTRSLNVRLFIDCNVKKGQRTDVGVSAIGSLRKAGCPQDLLIELAKNYCKRTGSEIKHFNTILYKL